MNTVFRKAIAFWRTYGTKALIWRLRGELSKRLRGTYVASNPLPQAHMPTVTLPVAGSATLSAKQLVSQRFAALAPLPCFQLPKSPHKRVTIVTDSINEGSLFGGVGTALILATLLANRIGGSLRVVTRTEVPKARNLEHVLSVYGLTLDGEAQFLFVPSYESRALVDFSDSDVFITTSWWTTASTLGAIPAKLVWYLLQEDERMFYPYGDDRLACEHVLQRKDLRFIVNTKLLHDHLSTQGMPHLDKQGRWFEPAFPKTLYYPRSARTSQKNRFVFYARPNNLRNLFYLGLEVIDAAIIQGVLDPDKWEIILMGKDIPEVSFGNGVVPKRMQNMTWSAYAELVGSVDLGLCLMATPHPSYPPLDLAASGAVIVTNTFGNKQNLQNYSGNLLCAIPDEVALLGALAQGVQLASNKAQRTQNFENNGLGQNWSDEMDGVLQHMQESL